MADFDLSRIATARERAADRAERLRVARAEESAARADLADALARGDSSMARAMDAQLARLGDEREAALGEVVAARREIADIAGRFLGRRTPEDAVATLSAQHPVLMLPVRLETRFFDGGTTLRIRVFPDQIHVTAHEGALTADEEAGLRWYWSHRWPHRFLEDGQGAPGDADRLADEAWHELSSRFRPGRAAFLVRAYPPDNFESGDPAPMWADLPRRASEWTTAAKAALLPDRWCAVGFQRARGGDLVEVFRVWGKPVPDSLAAGPTPDLGAPTRTGGLPQDPDLAWLHEPQAAEDVGMMLTVHPSDLIGGADLSGGVDRLMVLGVDWTLTPEQAGDAVNAHLQAIADEGLLAFVPQGVPSNSTSTQRSPYSTDPAVARSALAPHRQRTAGVSGRAASVAETALGLPAGVLDHVPGAELREQAWQGALLDALWPATGGYFLGEMLDPVLASAPGSMRAIREHIVQFLRASGPVPTLRVASVPYGMLPVTAPARFAARRGQTAQAQILTVTRAFRRLAEPLVADVPRLSSARSRDDVDAIMLKLLQRTPVPWSLTFRQLVGPVERLAVGINWKLRAAFQQNITAIILSELGCTTSPLLAELTHDTTDHPLDVPLVRRAAPTEADPEGTGYLAELLELLRNDAGRDILDGRTNAVALLEAYLAFAAVKQLDQSGKKTVSGAGAALGLSDEFTEYLTRPADRTPYSFRVEAMAVAPAMAGSRVPIPTTPSELADTVIPGLTGTATLAGHVAAALRERWQDLGSLLDAPEDPLHGLARLADGVQTLVPAPADQLEWAFRGTLDLYSTRLDAWITSLATARLAEQRASAPTGVHIGGWGIVEDLRADSGPSAESLGFVQAPSLGQATSLSILRSARASHRDAGGAIFDLDLSSRRVRGGLRIIDGVASGQRLAALLGYRIERGLQDADLRLAQWILPLRLECPLRSDRPDDPSVVEPVEAVAARDVVDGVAALARWASERDALLVAAGIAAGARAAVGAVLDDVAALADAVSDLLVSEAVHQAANGNLERSGAALAAHDRQAPASRPEFISTPRASMTLAHRAGVWLARGETDPAAGWTADLRSAGEPRLDRWLGQIFGPARKWTVSASIVRPPAAGADGVMPPEATPARTAVGHVSLADLGISALSAVMAARRPGADRPSELELRFALAFTAMAEAAGLSTDASDRLELSAEDLAPLLDLTAWASDVIDSTPLSGAELAPGDDPALAAAVVDAAEATARADTVRAESLIRVDALAAAVSSLSAGAGPQALADIMAALIGVMPLDGPDALPPVGLAPGSDHSAELAAHATEVLARVRSRLSAADVLASRPDEEVSPAGPDGSREEPAAVVKARGVIRILAGNDQPFLPVLAFASPSVVAAELADRAARLGGDGTAVAVWLHRSALVRPRLDSLAALLVHAEANGADVQDELVVIQLPHRPGAPWAALPFSAGSPPAHGTVGIVLHAPGGVDASSGGAGLIVDAWTESIPAAEETTAVAFHYDAPGARAPQTMLLAVHPEPGAATWDMAALIDSVHEAMDLARLRTLGSAELAPFSTFLPALFLPDSYTRDVPGIRVRELLENLAARQAGGLIGDHVLGKAARVNA